MKTEETHVSDTTDTTAHPTRGGGRKRSLSQRQGDLEFIAEKVLRGWTHQKISEELAKVRPYRISRSMVSLDVGELRRTWRADAADSFSDRQSVALKKLALVETEAWEAWDRSKSDGSPGNVAFLREVLTAIERCSKMLGLDAPVRTELSGPEGKPLEIEISAPPPELNDERVHELLTRHASRLGIIPAAESSEGAPRGADDDAGADASAG